MEFRHRANEEREPPMISSSSFYASQGYIDPLHDRQSLESKRDFNLPPSPISSAFFTDQPMQGYTGLNPMSQRPSSERIREQILRRLHHLLAPSISSSSFFAVQSMQDYSRLNPTHNRQSLEELKSELYEEKVREDIIARRMAQKRIVKEQIRRDMEMEREMRLLETSIAPLMIMPPEDQFCPHPIRREVEFDQYLPVRSSPDKQRPLMIIPPEDHIEPPLMRSQVEVDQQLPPRRSSNIEMRRHPINQLSFRGSPITERFQKDSPMKTYARKKRRVEATSSGTKDYSCALCQMSMTCKRSLDEHLKGKKHISKATQLGKCSSSSSSMPNSVKEKKNTCPRGGMKVRISVNGKMHDVIERERFLWCPDCNATCNTKDMMVSHLRGKSHLAKVS